MSPSRRRLVRAALFVTAGVGILFAGALGLRVLYPVSKLNLVRAAAEAADLDPALVCAVVRAESRFHADATSPRGAVGLMQIMPDTAAWISARLGAPSQNLRDPETNLRLGTWYLRYLMDRFGSLDVALAAYNAGPTRVDVWLSEGETTFSQTAAYVRRVLRALPVYRLYLAAPILVWATPPLPI